MIFSTSKRIRFLLGLTLFCFYWVQGNAQSCASSFTSFYSPGDNSLLVDLDLGDMCPETITVNDGTTDFNLPRLSSCGTGMNGTEGYRGPTPGLNTAATEVSISFISGAEMITCNYSIGGGQSLALSTGTNAAFLPVDLLTFRANPSKDRIELIWETAAEFENDYFTLEKSDNGRNFYESETIEGAGTSEELTTYFSTDYDPVPGSNYYRLSQTDFDGTTTVFQVVVVNYDKNGSINISPNPATDRLNLSFTEDFHNEPSEISIYDLGSGREVFYRNYQFTEPVISIDVDYLAKGMYVLSVKSDNKIDNQKFIKK